MGNPFLKGMTALLATCLIGFSQAALLHAQQHKNKIPIVGKLTSGNHQQAYSGRIQSLDLKQKILNVNSLHGRETEIFPVRKNVHVEGVNGRRMKLKALTPGMTVLIYYDQRSGERTVKNIVVLSTGKSPGKGKPAPSS